jgi:hypothetical protein
MIMSMLKKESVREKGKERERRREVEKGQGEIKGLRYRGKR